MGNYIKRSLLFECLLKAKCLLALIVEININVNQDVHKGITYKTKTHGRELCGQGKYN